MADQATVPAPTTNPATPPTSGGGSDAFANLVNSKLKKIEGGRKDKFADLVNSKLSKIQTAKPASTASTPPPEKPAEPIHSPSWWETTKAVAGWAASGTADILFGSGGGVASIPGVESTYKGTDLDPDKIVKQGVAKGDPTAIKTAKLQQEIHETFEAPLLNVSGSKPFQSVFDPNSKNAVSRFATGATKSVEGMTSIENLYSLGSIYAMPESIAKPMGLRFQADLATSGVQGITQATEATATGDEGSGAEAWGGMFGNLAVIVGMHYGEKGIHAGVDAIKNRDTTATLNEKAQTEYKKKFADLDDNQKAAVLYGAVEDANPKFRKRIDEEVDRMRERRAKKKQDAPAVDANMVPGAAAMVEANAGTEQERQDRLDAAKKFARQIVARRTREEAYKQQTAQREHETRQAAAAAANTAAESSRVQGEKDRAAEEAKSLEAQRGFGVTEGRVAELLPNRGVGMTTERESGQRYDPEHPEAGGVPIVDRRATAGQEIPEKTAQMTAAEFRLNEISERETGTSFSSKSVAEQRNTASLLEKNHPEAWEAFKKTPAYDQYVADVKHADMADATIKGFLERNPEGEPESLHPGADMSMGLSQLILNRIDVDSVFKSDPATHRDLNEHAERTIGKSFDSMDSSGKVAALASYLKEKPTKVLAFMTDDLKSRIGSGQHIDLANMDAESRAQLQQQTLMATRDDIRRTMDAGIAEQMVAEERKAQQQELTDAMYASLNSRTPSLEAVYATSKDMTAQAASLGLGQVNSLDDLFKIEKDALSLPARIRTPATNEFLMRMRQVRAAAEDHVLRELAEATAQRVRDNPTAAWEYNAKQVLHFSGQAADLRQAADDLRAQGRKQEADTAQHAADVAKAKAEAIVTGAQIASTPPPAPAARKPLRVSVGRETRIVTPRNPEGYKAHYAVGELTDLQTSHMPHTFEKRPGVNQIVQPRDYSTDTDAQVEAHRRTMNPDNDVFLANGVTSQDGPAVVDHDLHVVSANGRSISLAMMLRDNPTGYAKYVEDFHARAASFGIDPAEILKYEHPVLLKVLDEPVDRNSAQWALMGIDMNDSQSRGIGEVDMGAATANLLTPEFTDRLSGIIDSLDIFDRKGTATTVREAMSARSAEIAKLLTDAGVISPNRRVEFIDKETGALKEKAKDLFENLLMGLTVTDSSVIKDAKPAIKDKLTRAGMSFVKMKSAGENWNLASFNTDAIRLLNRAQDAEARLLRLATPEAQARGEGSESLIERYLHPTNYQDKNGFGPQVDLLLDGQAHVAPPHPAVEALARAIEESPRDYATMIAEYAKSATGTQLSMYGAEHPAVAFTNKIASRYSDGNGGKLSVAPEEWGTVAGLSDKAKAEIELGHGPLPVEPEVHAETAIADVTPDSSSVTEAIPEGPRTVQDLRKAIENFPGLTPELAEAASQMIEQFLPNALGMSVEELLGNRRLNFAIGGKDLDNRGYMQMIGETSAVIGICDSADISTFVEEVGHYIRQFMKPEHQSTANRFVDFKPEAPKNFKDRSGAVEFVESANRKIAETAENKKSVEAGQWEVVSSGDGFAARKGWSEGQEEMFTGALKRYHFDGGIRRGNMEKVFSTISKAMQSIYSFVTARKWAQGSKELNAMFDNWYDWDRAERKPLTTRLDPDVLADAAKGEWPKNLKSVDFSERQVSAKGSKFTFLDEEEARNFIKDKRNAVKAYRIYKEPGKDMIYVIADSNTKTLHQPGLSETFDLARKAKDLEAQLKKENDPRRQAWLRGQLNDVENKLRGSTFVAGGTPEPKDTSVIQLVHGLSEKPTMNEPTTPAQAVTVQQAQGDPTAISLGGDRGKPRGVPDGPAGVREEKPVDRVPEQAKPADGEPAPAKGRRGDGDIAKPAKSPLNEVKAAKLKAPDRQRGTPVADPDVWRGHVEALGLPTGTPPPTVRIDPDIRDLMIYPGQAEAIEGALSALQQHDATILAAPTGAGKSWMLSAIANHLLGTGGDTVGLLVTRSQNLIHEADGFVDTARKFGVDVDELPTKMADLQTGMYAATYAGIRGNRDLLTVPWDFVLFDESAEARNWTDSEQGKAVTLLGHAAKKVVYSSATPYSTVMELGYMHKLGLWPKGGFTEWARQFGLTEVGPNTYSGGTSAKKLEKLRQQIIERGQWQTLHKDMDGVEAHVALVPQTPEVRAGVRSIRQAFAMAMEGFKSAGMSRYLTPTAGHEAIYLKRYIESQRLPNAIELGKKAIADGWKPIFFSEYRSGAEMGMDFFHNLPGDMGAQINKLLPPLPDVVAKMREAFGDKVGIFAGEANDLRADELSQFMTGDKDALYMTYAAGGVGANPQDKVGDKPRMGIFLGLPWSGIMFEQSTGRPWRYGTMSNVANVFITSDTLPEMKVLATKILPRMRALKAAVYGEKMESKLSKNLRESVGIPEEMLQYEQGEEVQTQAAEWEKDGEGANYTHLKDFEMPKAKDAKNKGMKYKGQGKRLYQGPKEEDPWARAANDAWADVLKRSSGLPAPTARAITANEAIIKSEAAQAGRKAMGSGESVPDATKRKSLDMMNDMLLSDAKLVRMHGAQGGVRNIGRFVQENGWLLATSGDKVVEKAFKRAGMPELGEEVKRRMIDWDLRKGLYQGRLQGMLREIIKGNKITPKELGLVSKIVENKGSSDEPRINKAVAEFRKFTAHVRKLMADAGSVVVVYEDGKRKEVPYKAIEEDPNYWPRMYDWDQPFVIKEKDTGNRVVKTLAEIMNMPTGDERRERLINVFAESKGIPKLQAQAFFERNDRGIRLAGNVERARQFDIPMYGRDRQALERYIDQVSTTLATTEVHGQFRQKLDPLIAKLPDYESKLVNHIITSDLDPAHLPKSDRQAMSAFNTAVITGKMFYSPLKVGLHLWKAGLSTNTRSLVWAMFEGVTHPQEMMTRARDANALMEYSKAAWLHDYGAKSGGIAQLFLDYTGFTSLINFSRVISAGAGRLWFEKYAYPELKKDPENKDLRRKLSDLYGMSDEQLDNIVKNGYGPDDVRRMELGAANWTTGSNRPSEMPPAFRPGKNASPVEHRLATILRMTQSLHGFMFKTANLVNRAVFEQLYKSDWKSPAPYHLIGRFAFNAGLAGFALEQIQALRHRMSGSSEADIEKRRHEWLEQHPASAESLWWSMANISMAVGIQPMTELFNEMATRDPKDKQKLNQQHRVTRSAMGMILGIPGEDVTAILTAVEDYHATFEDTGHHKQDAETRRANIRDRLLNELVTATASISVLKPKKVEPAYGGRHKRVSSRM